jgi:hypothetical protein
MMYLVISQQNALDVNLPAWAIILLTLDPREAIKVAQGIKDNTNDQPYISSVFIYEMEIKKQYPLDHFAGRSETMYNPLVYALHKLDSENEWRETFFNDFKMFNRKRVDHYGHKASPGKL